MNQQQRQGNNYNNYYNRQNNGQQQNYRQQNGNGNYNNNNNNYRGNNYNNGMQNQNRNNNNYYQNSQQFLRNNFKGRKPQFGHYDEDLCNMYRNQDRKSQKQKELEDQFVKNQIQGNNSRKVIYKGNDKEQIAQQVERLPIQTVKNTILHKMEGNQVTIIAGDTGCGKSTQVPKYILEKNPDARILCTQPRRIAAVSLAQRVSKELNQKQVGDTVGYQIKTDSCQSSSTRILFVTTGMFLTKLVHSKEKLFEEFTHIIIDEIHERDIDSDFSMIAIKHYLAFNKKIKIILMSATINHNLFARYFSKESIDQLRNQIIQNNNMLYDQKKREKQGQIYDGDVIPNHLNQRGDNADQDILLQDQLEQFMNKYVRISNTELASYHWKKRVEMKMRSKGLITEQEYNNLKNQGNNQQQLQQQQQGEDGEVQEEEVDEWGTKGEKPRWEGMQQINTKLEDQEENGQFFNCKSKDPRQSEQQFQNVLECNDDNNNNWNNQFNGNLVKNEDPFGNEIFPNVIKLEQKVRFNVDTIYLNEIFDTSNPFSQILEEFQDQASCLTLSEESWGPQMDPELFEGALYTALAIVEKIIDNQLEILNISDGNKNGSILIFLPGIREIQQLSALIEDKIRGIKQNSIKIIELHGSLSDSQNNQQVMIESKQRKIIIATNIAESSITIPDCSYIIDFCLLKQQQYDLNSGIDKLTMCWASQASLKQRLGRIGRVSGGICFRLIPRKFFDYLQPFPTAEIQRCPLERLILRAKRLDAVEVQDQVQTQMKREHNIKAENTEDSDMYNISNLNELRMFRNPVEVLQRAINPPAKEDIGVTIRQLLHIGGIEEDEEKIYGNKYLNLKLTLLGLYFCDMPTDIRLSKFIALSHYFECYNEAIIISAILSSRHNFFKVRPNNNDQQMIRLLNILFEYDKGNESDILLRLKIYREWEKLFWQPYYKKRRDDYFKRLTNSKVSEDSLQRQIYLEFSRFYSQDEKQWCDQHMVGMRDMKDILNAKIDLQKRHNDKNDGIVEYKDMDLENKENMEKINFCFTSAFLHYSLATRENIAERQKSSVSLVEKADCDPRCTIQLELKKLFTNLYGFGEQELEKLKGEIAQIFNQYAHESRITEETPDKIQVKQIIWNHGNFLFIEFRQFNKETICFIKKIMAQKAIFSYRFNDKKKEINENDWLYHQDLFQRQDVRNNKFERVFLNSPCEFQYPFGRVISCLDITKNSTVHVDMQSINSMIFNYDHIPRYLISQGLQEKQQSKFSSMINFTIPKKNPLLLPFLGMIFGCSVRVSCDDMTRHYETIEFDGVVMPIKYYLFDEDIVEINKQRDTIRNYLTKAQFLSANEANKKQWKQSWRDITKEIIDKPRLRHVQADKWIKIYSDEHSQQYDSLKEIIQKGENPSSANSSNRRQRSFFRNEKRQTKAEMQFYSTQSKKFMMPIEKSQTQINNVDINTHTQIAKMESYYKYFLEWKRQVIKDQQIFKDQQKIKEMYIICGECWEKDEKVTPLAKFKGNLTAWHHPDPQVKFGLARILRILSFNSFLDGVVFKESKQNKDVYKNEFEESFLTQIQGFCPELADLLQSKAPVIFCCKEKQEHIIGVRHLEDKIHPFYKDCFLPSFVKLYLVYPKLEKQEKILFRKLNDKNFEKQMATEHSELVRYHIHQKQNEKNKQRCLICLDPETQLPFECDGFNEYEQHLIKKNKTHLQNLREFQDSINCPLFIRSEMSTDPE